MRAKTHQHEHAIKTGSLIIENGTLKKQTLYHVIVHHLISWTHLHFKVILLAVMCIQVLKGMAVYQHPYARAHYLWTYDKGFIKRGLIGSLTMYLAEGSEYRMLGIINFISYLGYFLFLLVVYRFLVRYSHTVTEKFLSILFAASPFILGMGSLLGYYDSFLMIILMMSFQVCNGKNVSPASCFALIITGLLIHELAVIFVVIPFLFQIWIHPFITRQRKFYLIAASCLICLLYLFFTFGHNGSFNQLLVSRLDQYAHVLATKSGKEKFISYGDYAIKNDFLHDFDVRRLILLEAYFPVYGFFILIISVTGTFKLLQLKKFMPAFLFAAVCYLPFSILLVAWDIERFICLTCCTAYICYLAVARMDERISGQVLRREIYLGMLLIVLVTLLTYYPIAEFYSESETLISRNKQKVLLQYPRIFIQNWFDRK